MKTQQLPGAALAAPPLVGPQGTGTSPSEGLRGSFSLSSERSFHLCAVITGARVCFAGCLVSSTSCPDMELHLTAQL